MWQQQRLLFTRKRQFLDGNVEAADEDADTAELRY